ncbi:MAG TPA: polysaccharide deacetylase family protein [Vicinamibacteria bacterium]|nr:polysaccharide deacetylase family protein [Vicinamibacteria bacterium]
MKRPVKRLLGHTLFASGLDAVLLRNTAVIVAFHRIHERADPDDGLTISLRMFERHCRFFRRHFRVVPLREIVERLERRQRLDRELAITFDDGYRDNFEVAAPVLERMSLPATFFVVSGWIGTDHVPWWDRERAVLHPWMSWDEVRALHRRGFEVGAHTRTHADLGGLSGDEARREIAGSRQELERAIGAPVELFAYPYGGAAHLSEANRDLVRAAGFRCCCSGLGGITPTGASPFHLPRVPISPWFESPQQLGFEVALGRSVLGAQAPRRSPRRAW